MISTIITLLIVAAVLVIGWFIFKSLMKFIMFFLTLLLIVLAIFAILAYMDYRTLSNIYDDSEKLILLETGGEIGVGFTSDYIRMSKMPEDIADDGALSFEFVDKEKLIEYSTSLKETGSVVYDGTVIIFNVDNLNHREFDYSISEDILPELETGQVELFTEFLSISWITERIMITEFISELKKGNIIMVPSLHLLKVGKNLPAFVTDKIKKTDNLTEEIGV